MTDNFEDLEHHDHEPGMEPQQPVGKPGIRSNLAEAWRTRPLFKLLVVMVVAGASIAAIASFLSSGSPDGVSRLSNPPDMHQAPGGQASPYFLQQTREAEKKREEEALKQGGSALPTPIGQPSDNNSAENQALNELRAETTRLRQQMSQVQQQQQMQPAQGNGQPERFDESLAQAMQNQMKDMMNSWIPKGIKEVSVTKDTGKDGSSQAGNGGANGANATNANATPIKTLVPAGTVSYAQLLVEANSDVPGPILAQIVSGPFAGAKAIGSFQIANGYNDYLVLHFSHASFKGQDYAMDAYALDPDTTLGGMATEVDQRYVTRLLLPAAASFLQAFGGAIGQSNSSTTVSGTGLAIVSQPSVGINQGLASGLGQAANIASQFFQNQANQTRPLVRVAAGTPMGMFFVNSVTDQAPTPQQLQPGVNTAGYPGLGGLGGLGGLNGLGGLGALGGNPYASALNTAGYPGGLGGLGGFGQSAGYGGGVPYPNAGLSTPSPNYTSGFGGGGGYGGNFYGGQGGQRY